MEYKEFMKQLKEQLESYLGNDMEVRQFQVSKPNLGKLDVLVIWDKKEGKYSVSPNFYVKTYYQKYQKGKTMEELVQEIAELHDVVRSDGETAKELDSLINSYKWVKKKVFFRLVNTGRNLELLENSPHIEYLDLSMIFYLLVGEDPEGMVSIRVTNDLLRKWKISPDKLRRLAVRNTETLFPVRSDTLDVAFCNLLSSGRKKVPEEPSEPEEMIRGMKKGIPLVLTNHKGLNGFSVILYQDCLKGLAEKIQKNLYILPSSCHEALVIPDKGDSEQVQELREMIEKVNRDCVLEEDFLSDEVYYYDREKDRL